MRWLPVPGHPSLWPARYTFLSGVSDQGREVSGRWTTPLSRALVVTESITGTFLRPMEGMVRAMMAPRGRWYRLGCSVLATCASVGRGYPFSSSGRAEPSRAEADARSDADARADREEVLSPSTEGSTPGSERTSCPPLVS